MEYLYSQEDLLTQLVSILKTSHAYPYHYLQEDYKIQESLYYQSNQLQQGTNIQFFHSLPFLLLNIEQMA